jgi:hypothetical protein
MKKLLISDNPYIRSYTYHTYPIAIIENYISDIIARIKFIGEDYRGLQMECEKIDVVENDEELLIKSSPYVTDNHCCFYRKMKNTDSLTLQILHQQYVNYWGDINIFISDQRERVADEDNYIYSYGNYCGDGLFLKKGTASLSIKRMNEAGTYPLFLKLVVHHEAITFLCSADGVNWDRSYDTADPEIVQEEMYIGVRIELRDNQYYNWLFANYIQLMLNDNWLTQPYNVPLDYYVTPRRKWGYYTLHNLVEYKRDYMGLIKDCKLNIIEYIMIHINHSYYVQVFLNERYIPDRKAYRSFDYRHPNLIYGYDEEKESLFIMGYNANGKPVLSEINYDEFNTAFIADDPDEIIYTLKYAPDVNPYKLDPDQIIYSIDSYLEGRNLSKDTGNLIVPLTFIFGIRVYDELMKDDEAVNCFIRDIRISYMLFEHKKIMRDRISYLIKKGVLDTETLSETIDNMDKIYKKSEIVNNLVIKYMSSESNEIRIRIRLLMEEIKELEIICYRRLSQLLKHKSRMEITAQGNNGAGK